MKAIELNLAFWQTVQAEYLFKPSICFLCIASPTFAYAWWHFPSAENIKALAKKFLSEHAYEVSIPAIASNMQSLFTSTSRALREDFLSWNISRLSK